MSDNADTVLPGPPPPLPSAALPATPFYGALAHALARRGLTPAQVCDLQDPVAIRLLLEYGAQFLAAAAVLVPPVCMFADATAVEQFQTAARPQAAAVGATLIELQPAALAALLAARAEAQAAGLDITPRGGAAAARRSYADTLRLWSSRVEPALAHWTAQGRISAAAAVHVRALAPAPQVAAVLALEAQGYWFSKNLAKSILHSVAAPGASQHLALLAFDAAEFTDARVRAMLARHGWFQTVQSDLPHFTFLGVREKDLPALGLRPAHEAGQTFWLPALD